MTTMVQDICVSVSPDASRLAAMTDEPFSIAVACRTVGCPQAGVPLAVRTPYYVADICGVCGEPMTALADDDEHAQRDDDDRES